MKRFWLDLMQLLISATIILLIIYLNIFSINQINLILSAPIFLVSLFVIWRLMYSPVYLMRRLLVSIIPFYIIIHISTDKLGKTITSLLVATGQFNESVSNHVSSILEFIVSNQQFPLSVLLVVAVLAMVEILFHSPILDLLRSRKSKLFIQQQTNDRHDPLQQITRVPASSNKYKLKYQISVTAVAESKADQLVQYVRDMNKISVSCFIIDWPIDFDYAHAPRDLPDVAEPTVDLSEKKSQRADVAYNLVVKSRVLTWLLYLNKVFNSKTVIFKVGMFDTNKRQYLTHITLPLDFAS